MFFLQETAQKLAENGAFASVEQPVITAVGWLRLGVETIGAAIICIGVVAAVYQLVRHFSEEQKTNFNRIRLTLGKYLALALEFQVGADILSTAIAPSWEQIGKLAAIAAIRTLLNYFLTREMEHEQKREEQGRTEK
ncbi:MAG TPA: DUF1622 domain-containing protein [Pyrinomonadaceae bacterium]|nr:DUF1622 domain-containing protein [Pyrinomonadaceae bacterium]